jgi:hypothetical protein
MPSLVQHGRAFPIKNTITPHIFPISFSLIFNPTQRWESFASRNTIEWQLPASCIGRGTDMGYLKFLSREKLIECLDGELRQILNGLELYEITQYGWLGDGEQDPEYRGLAVWQINPPELQKLAKLGDEFTNLMCSTLHSLGLSLLYQVSTATSFIDYGDGFNFYFTDTVNKLNLATDRVREFLITAFVRQAPWGAKSWPAAGKMIRGEGFYNYFRHPFRQIKEEVDAWTDGNHPLSECLNTLQPLAEQIARYRAEHQDPTRHLNLFQDRLTIVAANLNQGYPDDACSDSLAKPDCSLLEELGNWYRVLIETGNQVFLAEHLLRGLAREAGTMSRRAPHQQII